MNLCPLSSLNVPAVAVASSTHIFVGMSDGSIHVKDLSVDTGIVDSIRMASGKPITLLLVDFMQERLYALIDRQTIVQCQYFSCANETSAMFDGSIVVSMAIDSWNGYGVEIK